MAKTSNGFLPNYLKRQAQDISTHVAWVTPIERPKKGGGRGNKGKKEKRAMTKFTGDLNFARGRRHNNGTLRSHMQQHALLFPPPMVHKRRNAAHSFSFTGARPISRHCSGSKEQTT